jgi:tetratricopeptide (TPR) repeat protein
MQNKILRPVLLDTSAESLGRLKQKAESSGANSQDRLNYANALFQFGDIERATDFLSSNLIDDQCMSRLREYYIGERMNTHAITLVQRFEREKGISSKIDEAIRSHLAGNIKQALAFAREAIVINPEHAEAYNHAARALFNMRLTQEALTHFEKALSINPNYAEAWHNLAHLYRTIGNFDLSEQCYKNALKITPNYVSALVNYSILCIGSGRTAEALPMLEKALKINPSHAEAHLNAGICQHIARNYRSAEFHYRESIRLDPNNPFAFRHMGSMYNERSDTENATIHLKESLRLNPHGSDVWAELISCYEMSNQLDEAEIALDEALKIFPSDPNILFEKSKLLRRKNTVDESLSVLRTINPRELHPRLLQPYYYELGTALDRNSEPDLAYQAFEYGNKLASSSNRAKNTDASAVPRQITAVNEWLAVGGKSSVALQQGDLGSDLCFLIGFPRSGTTLLDVMLDSHPSIQSIEERVTIEHLAHQLGDHKSGFPNALQSINPKDAETLRGIYRQIIAENGIKKIDGNIIVDKMPIRTYLSGFIHRVFPQAKFIFALRHPCDVILSNFMQHYAINEGMVHFLSIESAVSMYDQVLKNWQKTLSIMPIKKHYVRYEELVQNTDYCLRSTCEFLGVAWDPNMANHQSHLEERGRIKTNSYHQVAQPIYQRSRNRWHAYKKHFEPHREVLQPHLDYFGYGWDD